MSKNKTVLINEKESVMDNVDRINKAHNDLFMAIKGTRKTTKNKANKDNNKAFKTVYIDGELFDTDSLRYKSFVKPTNPTPKQSVIKLSKKMKVIDLEKPYNDSNELMEYIWRRKNGHNIRSGVIVGNVVDGVIRIGWSKCKISEDPFCSYSGINIARTRLIKDDGRKFLFSPEAPFVNISDEELKSKVPDCIRSQVRNFGSRCLRYYKTANKLEIPD